MRATARKILVRPALLLAAPLAFLASEALPQANPFTAPSSAIDTLSDAPVAPAGGNYALNNARAVAAPPAGGGMGRRRGMGGDGALSLAGIQQARGAAPAPGAPPPAGGVVEAAAAIVKPKIKAIVGTRVFDSVTGELLDDARITYIEESEKGNYYDDGTHGDLVREDGEYAKVDERRDVLGQSNQRIKEQLIQALNRAEELDPVEFFGYSLLSFDRTTHPPRNRTWKIVPEQSGRPGFRLAEIETDRPLEVPKYRAAEQEKDTKIAGADGWAVRFLDEYRITKGDPQAEFYPPYVPKPPSPPSMPPPVDAGWTPFPAPAPVAAPAQASGALGGGGAGRGFGMGIR